jgi:hypothetical protein
MWLLWIQIWNCTSLFTSLTWLSRLRIRVPSLRTRHVSSWGIHGSHWIGGTPTEYLSTASVRVDLSSSYVSSQRTYVTQRKLISLTIVMQDKQQAENLHYKQQTSNETICLLSMAITSPCTNTHCYSRVKLRPWQNRCGSFVSRQILQRKHTDPVQNISFASNWSLFVRCSAYKKTRANLCTALTRQKTTENSVLQNRINLSSQEMTTLQPNVNITAIRQLPVIKLTSLQNQYQGKSYVAE